jgi:RHH-type proline utilization regulon transcriptional repressor/proline dehydrogenase/delta 1-pyrroline-5-carboxylate dehydrogenase
LSAAQRERVSVGACNYGDAYAKEIGVDHDPSGVVGERNLFRYVPCAPLLIRASEDAELTDLMLALVAAKTVGATTTVSIAAQHAASWGWLERLPGWTVRFEDVLACTKALEATVPERMSDRVSDRVPERVRCIGSVEPELASVVASLGVSLVTRAVLLTGRVELLAYVREQSLSHRYHRFGNLAGERLLPKLRRSS